MSAETWMDGDGYPTEAALKRIEEWPYSDVAGWFAFIRSVWHFADWGWTERRAAPDVTLIYASTGGWSGNESIVDAMGRNSGCWSLTWRESSRGGHYRFEYRLPEEGRDG